MAICELLFLPGSSWWSSFEPEVGLETSSGPHQQTLLYMHDAHIIPQLKEWLGLLLLPAVRP